MRKKIRLHDREIEYELVIGGRGRSVRLSIRRDMRLVVTVPRGADERIAERFILEKSRWIAKKLDFLRANAANVLDDSGADPILHKRNALALAESRLAHWNGFYRFDYANVSIRNQKTRWGSCSRKGNLNFNRKITLLPLHLVDYVVVHELCHLREFNHSPEFWGLVAKAVPDHRELRKELRKFSLA